MGVNTKEAAQFAASFAIDTEAAVWLYQFPTAATGYGLATSEKFGEAAARAAMMSPISAVPW